MPVTAVFRGSMSVRLSVHPILVVTYHHLGEFQKMLHKCQGSTDYILVVQGHCDLAYHVHLVINSSINLLIMATSKQISIRIKIKSDDIDLLIGNTTTRQ